MSSGLIKKGEHLCGFFLRHELDCFLTLPQIRGAMWTVADWLIVESGLLERIASAAFVFFLGAHFLGIFTLRILKYRLTKTVRPGYLP